MLLYVEGGFRECRQGISGLQITSVRLGEASTSDDSSIIVDTEEYI